MKNQEVDKEDVRKSDARVHSFIAVFCIILWSIGVISDHLRPKESGHHNIELTVVDDGICLTNDGLLVTTHNCAITAKTKDGDMWYGQVRTAVAVGQKVYRYCWYRDDSSKWCLSGANLEKRKTKTEAATDGFKYSMIAVTLLMWVVWFAYMAYMVGFRFAFDMLLHFGGGFLVLFLFVWWCISK